MVFFFNFVENYPCLMNRLFTLALVFFSLSTFAQSIEITPNYGYRVGGKIDVYYGSDLGYLRINDSQSYGVDLSYPLRPDFAINLSWFGQSTTLDFYDYGFGAEINQLGDISVNYYLLNGLYEKPGTGITPFGGFGIGLSTARLTTLDSDVLVRFAASLQAGVKFDLSSRLGFRIRAAMLTPLQFGSGGLFCGIGTGGSGCNVSVGASSTIIQGDFSAGIVLKLGGDSQPTSPTTSPTW